MSSTRRTPDPRNGRASRASIPQFIESRAASRPRVQSCASGQPGRRSGAVGFPAARREYARPLRGALPRDEEPDRTDVVDFCEHAVRPQRPDLRSLRHPSRRPRARSRTELERRDGVGLRRGADPVACCPARSSPIYRATRSEVPGWRQRADERPPEASGEARRRRRGSSPLVLALLAHAPGRDRRQRARHDTGHWRTARPKWTLARHWLHTALPRDPCAAGCTNVPRAPKRASCGGWAPPRLQGAECPTYHSSGTVSPRAGFRSRPMRS